MDFTPLFEASMDQIWDEIKRRNEACVLAFANDRDDETCVHSIRFKSGYASLGLVRLADRQISESYLNGERLDVDEQ